jgi:hypothetical protein
MRRTRTGKSLALTSRDLAIFHWLSRYRYLRSTYLYAFAGGLSETRFKERLGDLFHEGFLDRPARQWEFADAKHAPAVYELGDRGRRALSEVSEISSDTRTFIGRGDRQFQHAALTCASLASIELATKSLPLRFVGWSELLTKAPERTRRSTMPQRIPVGQGAVIPDGLFGLEYLREDTKAYRFFALELDRNTMPLERTNSRQTSYLAKLHLYQEIIATGRQRTHWGIPNLLVLSVMPDQQRVSGVITRLEGHTPAAALLFKAVDPVRFKTPFPSLLFAPWERSRQAPIDITGSQ